MKKGNEQKMRKKEKIHLVNKKEKEKLMKKR